MLKNLITNAIARFLRVERSGRDDRRLDQFERASIIVLRNPQRTRLTFSTNSDPASIEPLLAKVITRLSRFVTSTENWLFDVELAIREALLNAVYHGNLEIQSELWRFSPAAFYRLAQQRCSQLPYRDRQVDLIVEIIHSEILFTIHDEGPGFDVATIPDPIDAKNLDKPCGRGLTLMRNCMDQVTFRGVGNTVQMSKRIEQRKMAA